MMYSNIVFANNQLCIALTNASKTNVEFVGLIPRTIYTVQPKQKATLSYNDMADACYYGYNDCAIKVFVLDGSGEGEIISDLPRGTRIIYYALHQYHVDKNANVPCL